MRKSKLYWALIVACSCYSSNNPINKRLYMLLLDFLSKHALNNAL